MNHFPSQEIANPSQVIKYHKDAQDQCAVNINIKFYYTNAQSLRNKLSELNNIAVTLKPGVIGITETWLTDEIYDGEVALKDYTLFRKDRMHGGVCFYIHNNIDAVPCEELNKSNFSDALFCWISSPDGGKYLVGICYRSPNSSDENNKNLLLLLDSIDNLRLNRFWLMGDFNFPEIDFESFNVRAGEASTPSIFFKKIT